MASFSDTSERTAARRRVGTVGEFPLNEFRLFEVAGREVGVIRTEDGFYAIRNLCPHQAAALCAGRVTGTFVPSAPHSYEYEPAITVVICPWHRWEFDLRTGESVGGTAGKRAVTYVVEVEDGEVYVLPRRGSESTRRAG